MGALRPFIFVKGLDFCPSFWYNIYSNPYRKVLVISYMDGIIKCVEIILMTAGVFFLLIVAHNVVHKLKNKEKK